MTAGSGALRFAVIGSGGMGHARATHLGSIEGAALTCVSSRNPMTGPAFAKRFGAEYVADWSAAVSREDVDAVFVTTHNDSHAEIALSALEHGKHVFIEYPLATRLDDADALIRAASRRGLAIEIGHDQALVGWHAGIKAAAGKLGELRAVNGVLATPSRGGGRSVWRNIRLSGPPFMVGIAYLYHLLDLFGHVEWVEGTCTYDSLDESGYYRSSTSTMTASFRRGGVAQLLYIRGFAVPRDEQEQAMMFSKGFLSYRGYVSGSQTNSGQLTEVTPMGSHRLEFPPGTLAQASRQNTERFVARVRSASADGGRVFLAREAVAMALGADQAATERRRVYLERVAVAA